MKLTFLGTSDSAGFPVYGCSCVTCTTAREEKTHNLYTNSYIELNEKDIILIDCGHDVVRLFQDKNIIAIFLTHFHADHSQGLLRLRYSPKKIPCFCPKDKNGMLDLFTRNFAIEYTWNKAFKPISIRNISFTPLPLIHGRNTNGYFIETPNKKIAYLTDTKELPNETYNFLKNINIDITFLDACFHEERNVHTHNNYLEAKEILENLNSKENFLIHANHFNLSYLTENNIKTKYPYIRENFSIKI